MDLMVGWIPILAKSPDVPWNLPWYGEKNEKTPGEMAEECKDLVQSTVDGHNVTIFACGDMRKLAQLVGRLVGRLVGWSWEWDRWIYFWWLGGDHKWEDDLGVSGTETEATNDSMCRIKLGISMNKWCLRVLHQPLNRIYRHDGIHLPWPAVELFTARTPWHAVSPLGTVRPVQGKRIHFMVHPRRRCEVYPLGCWDVQEESF